MGFIFFLLLPRSWWLTQTTVFLPTVNTLLKCPRPVYPWIYPLPFGGLWSCTTWMVTPTHYYSRLADHLASRWIQPTGGIRGQEERGAGCISAWGVLSCCSCVSSLAPAYTGQACLDPRCHWVTQNAASSFLLLLAQSSSAFLILLTSCYYTIFWLLTASKTSYIKTYPV